MTVEDIKKFIEKQEVIALTSKDEEEILKVVSALVELNMSSAEDWYAIFYRLLTKRGMVGFVESFVAVPGFPQAVVDGAVEALELFAWMKEQEAKDDNS